MIKMRPVQSFQEFIFLRCLYRFTYPNYLIRIQIDFVYNALRTFVPVFPFQNSMKKYKSVDHFMESLEQWQPEIIRLREIMVSTDLEETLKWSFPCYVYNGKNVAGIGGFKSYFGLWFFQGR